MKPNKPSQSALNAMNAVNRSTAVNSPATPAFDVTQIEGSDLISSFNANIQSELQICLKLLQQEYGSYELLEYLYISEEGILCLYIPAEQFHTKTAGYFQLVLQWPKVKADVLVAKVSISFKMNADRHLTLLSTGGGSGDSIGFMSLNSAAEFDVDAMISKGYIATEAADTILTHCIQTVGVKGKESRRILTPVDGTFVYAQLRHTIVPAEGKGDPTIKSQKKPGDVANLAIDMIHFEQASLLGQNAQLKGDLTYQPRSASALMMKYLGTSNPLAPTMINPLGDTVASALTAEQLAKFSEEMA